MNYRLIAYLALAAVSFKAIESHVVTVKNKTDRKLEVEVGVSPYDPYKFTLDAGKTKKQGVGGRCTTRLSVKDVDKKDTYEPELGFEEPRELKGRTATESIPCCIRRCRSHTFTINDISGNLNISR